MKNDQKPHLAKKAAPVKGRSSNSSNPERDAGAALLARFSKYSKLTNRQFEAWINK